MISTLRSLWTWIAITTLIVVWVPYLWIVRKFDRDPAIYNTGLAFRRIGRAMTRVNPYWKVNVSGHTVENPRNPYVVVSNHQSYADIPILCWLRWEMKWVGKTELFKVPFVGRLMRLAGDIELNRGDAKSGAKVLITARDYLNKKCSVIFFPEGTRSKDGRLGPFSDGAFRLAIKAGVPLLPVVVDGTQNALPKHTWKFGEARAIRVKVLPAIDTTGLTAADSATLRDRVRGLILHQLSEWRGLPAEVIDSLPAENKDSVNTSLSSPEREPSIG